ncbi:putative ferulic acid Esterase/Feruloyl esterase precursor [Zymoseptoria tritici IPO323]|uniref:Carboxylic ester hydrolase n=1 Tax=Zymoseptoria tritici (strain CBS 115943 / IPO323) TaxID=336722 RepID=F9X9E1_ZYMTI|nr:putative ferulic acid Esterase/Feruloyl esterase precursor [Zymoseptoria tritici IPO323]EGP87860.1 putative ferulic acid Esterase/Feruloyl esterase precursor [Zymoseptoria tritici IPO323]
MGSFPSTPVPSVPPNSTMTCASLCSTLTFPPDLATDLVSCVPYAANSTITIEGGQRDATCGTTVTPSVDICRVVLNVITSSESQTYMEVWLPDGETEWNGRTMSTDNGGVNGCVKFVDMNYAVGLGFAAIGDNAGHNGSSFDGSWFAESNELILDWVYRARHASVQAGKSIVQQFYSVPAAYSYYIGCSAGGAQGLKSAQVYPNDFDGIISGSAAADFNHLQAWSGRFVQLTGLNTTDPKFLTQANWITVQAAILDQCDESIDGVADGILEDPTQCAFDSSVLSCTNNATLSGCLTDTQVNTVNEVFTALYDTAGDLLFPGLLYGSQVDAFRLGQLSGSIQGISSDWYRLAVLKDPSWNPLDMDQADYALADSQDREHGGVSGWSGDLSQFNAAGGKLLMFHGMADPLVAASNSQRYYLKVAQTMGLDSPQMDDFLRFFRISGMAHCGVGGISGAGAWMFGQNKIASAASTNIITELQNWVENDSAPDTLTGTKFWWDTPSLGIQFERRHCRFPYRTTFVGGGADPNSLDSWSCVKIDDWQECAVGATPRLCNADGSFK